MATFIRCLLLLPVAALAAAAPLSAQELPKKDAIDSTDLEPKLMLNDLPDLVLPEGFLRGENPPLPAVDIARLEAEVARARKTAAWRERLWKAGVLAKVEAEQAALKVVRLTRDLADARLQAITRATTETRQRANAGKLSKEALAEAEAALTAATTEARAADTHWVEAQRHAAELRVQRERKLFALGAGSRNAVKRAEAALQNLTSPPDR